MLIAVIRKVYYAILIETFEMLKNKYISFKLFKHSTRALNDPIRVKNSTHTQE